jgi:chromosome segregation ATPase
LAGKSAKFETAAKDLEQVKADLEAVNQNLTTAQENIAKEKEAIAQLKVEFDAAVAEGKKAMTELEGKYDFLNQEKGALEVKVTDLDNEIAETNKKLTDSEGDRDFLEGELTRLQDEKAELVSQMNNLDFVTTQYKQLRSDFREAQRLDWARRGVGIYAKRETIIQRNARLRGETPSPVSIAKDPSVPDKVQVELTSDGKVKINGKLVEPVKQGDETPAPQPEVINPVAPTPVPGQN